MSTTRSFLSFQQSFNKTITTYETLVLFSFFEHVISLLRIRRHVVVQSGSHSYSSEAGAQPDVRELPWYSAPSGQHQHLLTPPHSGPSATEEHRGKGKRGGYYSSLFHTLKQWFFMAVYPALRSPRSWPLYFFWDV